MFVRMVRLTNLRSRHDLQLEVREGLNILVGPNGAGKTTALEAIALVLRGVPLRSGNLRDLISRDRDHLRVELELDSLAAPLSVGDAGTDLAGRSGPRSISAVTAAAAYSRDGERRLSADGAVLDDAARWRDLLPVRTFAPDDLRLIKGSPRRRREYLDSLAGRQYREYPSLLKKYEEALSQRNFLLRTVRGGLLAPEFEPWETILAQSGSAVTQARASALASFVSFFQRVHEELTGEPAENVRLVYRTNAADLGEAEYRGRLQEMRRADQQRTYTHLGPHRDDLRVLRCGLDMRECASQGEQRTALLALVLAEWERLLDGPASPLLLLDDVMSELDESRRRRLVAFTRRGGQTVVTTTDLRYFSAEELEGATIVDLGSHGG